MELRFAPFAFGIALALGAVGCGDSGASIDPLSPQTVAVSETLIVPLVATGGDELTFAFEAPEGLPAFRSTASIRGTARAGGEFRWTPLASHVGTREIIIQLLDGGTVVAETPLLVTVSSSEDAAPIFLRPGAGGTFDLTEEPCILIPIEVRDDDSARVTIEADDLLPEGASIAQTDDKIAELMWCPTGDQIATSERYTLSLAADDGTRRTVLDYIAVLRGDAKPGCPGEAPVVNIVSPGEGDRVAGGSGYAVRASVTDDMGLRDAPLLFYSTAAPDDPTDPDITTFEQVVMRPSGDEWTGRIPSLPLEEGMSETLYVVVSATDNDDGSGASCDHRTDSTLLTFEALSGSGGELEGCDPCSASAECASGLCASDPSGGRCVPSCSGGGACEVGSCGATATTEGSVLAGCGPIEDVCDGGGGGTCTDDSRENNDTRATASMYGSPISDGQICPMDDDFFRVSVAAGERVTVALTGFVHAEGDLDLQIQDGTGSIVATSASTSNMETANYCFATAGMAYARVFGYSGAANSYALRIDKAPDPSMCCVDDANEENDTRATAHSITVTGGSADFDGTVCPRDDDWYAFNVTAPSQVQVDLVIGETGQDLDLELRDPSGALVGSSRSTTDEESIDVRVTTSGRYTVGVLGFLGASSDYLGSVTIGSATGCTTSRDCPIDSVCGSGSCVPRACTAGGSTCPSGHICPTFGPGTSSQCGASCTVNSDCRSSEACKWYPQGRYCGVRGSGGNGDACANAAVCGGQRACVPWPGGTCARAGCTRNADCETDTYCVRDTALGYNVCARSCWTSDDECRSTGYSCDVQSDIGGDTQLVCLPG